MRLEKLLFIALLLLGLMFYIQYKSNKKDDVAPVATSSAKVKKSKVAPTSSRIMKSIELSPKKIGPDSTITVNVKFNKKLEEDPELEYYFIVNGKMVEKNREGKLPPGFIKGNTSIYCQVKLLKDNKLVETMFSPISTVVISPAPTISKINFPKINAYGTYQITCDVENKSKEELKFSLQCPKELEDILSIDSKTGTVSLELEKGKKLPNQIKWTIKVENKKGSYSSKEASISLGMKEIIVEKKKEEKKDKKDKEEVKKENENKQE